jgi:hypothetical protein
MKTYYVGWMYRSTYSWPRHELEVSGHLHAPAALSLREGPQVLVRIRYERPFIFLKNYGK